MTHNVCAECGAVIPDEHTCRSVFEEFLGLEFTDPEYGRVHFLTVACYMVQHGQYTDEALVWIEQKLRDYLEKGIAVEEIRKGAKNETNQSTRSWKVTRRDGDPPQKKIAWSMTIRDVADQVHDAQSYRDAITNWARSTLAEMGPLLRP